MMIMKVLNFWFGWTSISSTARRFSATLLSTTGLLVMLHAQASEKWMASTDPFGRGPDRPNVALDYLDLFNPSAHWVIVAHHLTVFKVGSSIVDQAPMRVLKHAFANLRRRRIALAWEMGAIPPGTNCGGGEGYAGDTAQSVARIKAAGGYLKYVAMDEPFWFGHHVDTKDSCKLSITDVATGVAKRLDAVRAVFPDVQIGDIEPIGSPGVDQYPDQLIEWVKAFRQATGRRLAFFHADIDWHGPWREHMEELQPQLARLGIPVGIIINGDPFAKTDLDWSNAAIAHLQEAVDVADLRPEAIIFQTWDDRPSRMLPENQPGTLTNVVLEGSRPAAKISFKPKGSMIMGRVEDKAGKAIANATVNITVRDVEGLYGLHVVQHIGTVPQYAVNGLFGLRVGIECSCGGPIDISIGRLHYRDGSGPKIVQSLQNRLDSYSLHEKPGAQIDINTATFAVTAGAKYTVEVPIAVWEHPDQAGYLALFFLDSNGREIRRDPIELRAADQPMGTTVTNRKGEFSVPFPKNINPASELIRTQTQSNSSTRATLHELAPAVGR